MLYPLSLKTLFGENATEDNQFLKINKADLSGLTASSSNRSTQLLAAILIKALETFSDEIRDENDDALQNENGDSLNFDNTTYFECIEVFFWANYFDTIRNTKVIRTQVIIHLYGSN
jgi:hypothetical protein